MATILIGIPELITMGVCRDSIIRFARTFGQEAKVEPEEILKKIDELGLRNWDVLFRRKVRRVPA